MKFSNVGFEGSIVDPFFVLVYLNDLPKCVQHNSTSFAIFVDDTPVLKSGAPDHVSKIPSFISRIINKRTQMEMAEIRPGKTEQSVLLNETVTIKSKLSIYDFT